MVIQMEDARRRIEAHAAEVRAANGIDFDPNSTSLIEHMRKRYVRVIVLVVLITFIMMPTLML